MKNNVKIEGHPFGLADEGIIFSRMKSAEADSASNGSRLCSLRHST